MHDQQGRKRFLMERGFEPRTTVWRPDIAAPEFDGMLPSTKYHEPVRLQTCVPWVSLRFEPYSDSPVEDQLLFGETFLAYDFDYVSGLAWGQIEHDHHVGFVSFSGFSREVREPTHWVSVPKCPVLPRPDRKAEPRFVIALNARVTVLEIDHEDPIYAKIGDGMWVFRGDLREIGDWLADPLAPLEELVGVSSYIWGWRNGIGYDCSGLTQAVHRATGRFCYRDADQQEYDPGFGTELPFTGAYDGLQRFDQVYFPGHVAVMVNETDAMHAKGEDVRKLVIEPIREIDAWRVRDCAGGIRTVKRF